MFFFLVVDNILRHHISPLGRGHFNKILRHWWPYVLSRLPVVPVSKLILFTFNDDTELDWRPSAVVDDQFLLKNFSGGGGGGGKGGLLRFIIQNFHNCFTTYSKYSKDFIIHSSSVC